MSIEVMKQALETMELAIKAGDWIVDGACDPDMALVALRQAIEQAETKQINSTTLMSSTSLTNQPLTDEVVKLRGEMGVLVGLLGAALQVIETVDGDDADECQMLMELQNKITYAIQGAST